MNEYRRLFQFLQLPQAAIDIAFRDIALPFYSEGPFDTYGFVPALLPLWSADGMPRYTGYWKHWFGPRRMTLVDVTVENNRHAEEVARTFEQLTYEVVLTAVEAADGIDSEAVEFGGQVGLSTSDLEQIERAWQEYGDERSVLLPLPAFASAPPLVCFPEEEEKYGGDFPFNAMPLSEEVLRNMCTFEAGQKLRQRISALPFAPPWFTADDQAPVFDGLLQRGDFAGAWMSLNSTGWRFLEAKEALKRLAQQADVPGLDLLAEAWCAVPHERNGITPETASY